MAGGARIGGEPVVCGVVPPKCKFGSRPSHWLVAGSLRRALRGTLSTTDLKVAFYRRGAVAVVT